MNLKRATIQQLYCALIGVVVLSLAAAQGLASDPPAIPANAKVPLTLPASEPDEYASAFSGKVTPRRYSEADRITRPMSGVLNRTSFEMPPVSAKNSKAGGPTANSLPSGYSLLYNSPTDTSQNHAEETSIRTITLNSVPYTTVAYNRNYIVNNLLHVRIGFANSSNSYNWTTSIVGLPCCTGPNGTDPYSDAGDPILGENPYTTGVGPGNIYLSGTTFNRDSFGAAIAPSSIRVWVSSSGGTYFSPSGSEVYSSATNIQDKPVMSVSWAPATLGYVYVAWVDFGATNRILLRRSRNGVSKPRVICPCIPTWDNVVEVVGPNVPNAAYNGLPQVVVDDVGNVYVFWLNVVDYKIYMRRSLDAGVTFGPTETVASNVLINGSVLQNVRSRPVPWAKWNAAAGKLVVVWHQRESSTASNTDLFFTSKTPSGTWPVPVRLFAGAVGDQFQPAFDYDSSGNMLVSYYSSQGDPSNVRYQEYIVYISSSGTTLMWPAPVRAQFSDPANWSSFIGDYQDSWRWNITDTLWPAGFRWQIPWAGEYTSSVGGIITTGIQ